MGRYIQALPTIRIFGLERSIVEINNRRLHAMTLRAMTGIETMNILGRHFKSSAKGKLR